MGERTYKINVCIKCGSFMGYPGWTAPCGRCGGSWHDHKTLTVGEVDALKADGAAEERRKVVAFIRHDLHDVPIQEAHARGRVMDQIERGEHDPAGDAPTTEVHDD